MKRTKSWAWSRKLGPLDSPAVQRWFQGLPDCPSLEWEEAIVLGPKWVKTNWGVLGLKGVHMAEGPQAGVGPQHPTLWNQGLDTTRETMSQLLLALTNCHHLQRNDSAHTPLLLNKTPLSQSLNSQAHAMFQEKAEHLKLSVYNSPLCV